MGTDCRTLNGGPPYRECQKLIRKAELALRALWRHVDREVADLLETDPDPDRDWALRVLRAVSEAVREAEDKVMLVRGQRPTVDVLQADAEVEAVNADIAAMQRSGLLRRAEEDTP
jgi:hypothetical protein